MIVPCGFYVDCVYMLLKTNLSESLMELFSKVNCFTMPIYENIIKIRIRPVKFKIKYTPSEPL